MRKEKVDQISQLDTPKSDSEIRQVWRHLRKNRMAMIGLAILFIFLITSIFAPYLTPHDPVKLDLINAVQPPSSENLMGTDWQGRDVFSRILHGGRISLAIGFITVIIGLGVGIPVGTLSGYFGGKLDLFVQRLIDIMLAFPGILLAIVVVAILGVGVEQVMIAVGISTIPIYTRLVRGSVLSVKEEGYITAARGLGIGDARIVVRHILPNCLGPIIVMSTFRIATSILWAAGLGFLGLGAQPPDPEWGAMLSRGREYMRAAPYLTTFPGMAIFLLVLGFNLIGDGLRDALDPRSRRYG